MDGTDPVDVVAHEVPVVVDHRIDRTDGLRSFVDGVEVVDDPHLVGHGDAETPNAEGPHRRNRAGDVLGAKGDVDIVQSGRPVGGRVHGNAEAAGTPGNRAAEDGVGGWHGSSGDTSSRDRGDDFSAGPDAQDAPSLPTARKPGTSRAMKILCVTPNVSIDRTLTVPGFLAGGVFRTDHVAVSCGGKGVNVARALGTLGVPATCIGLVGGHNGGLAVESAAAEGLDTEWSWRNGESRITTIVVGSGGQATVLNETGAPVSAADWAKFEADVAGATNGCDAVCLSGSFPLGVPPGGVGRLIAAAAAGRRPVWVDTSGAALADALDAGAGGIKVNGIEAGEVLDRDVTMIDDAVSAAEEIRRRGVGAASLTLGEAGAVLVTRDGAWRVRVPAVAVTNAVGSGDTFLAGLVGGLARAMAPADALRWGAAAGTANAMTADAGRIDRGDFARVFAATEVDVLYEKEVL